MQLITHTPAKALSPAFRTQSLSRDSMERFKQQFTLLRSHVANAANESEEHLKNIVADFLKGVWYRDTHYINTRDRQDLVIHTGKTAKDPVGVILEVKRPGNRAEMITAAKANGKALHELLLYYLRERQRGNNREIKHLIITNIEEWYIFDAANFERHIYNNTQLLKRYTEWEEKRLGVHKTDWFYEEIAAPFFEKELPSLDATYFRLADYVPVGSAAEDDETLLDLYKVLSPEHLLKKPFANDANSLNKQFYDELLYILGLEEFKEGGKKIIQRAEKRRHEGSLLENTLNKLEVSGKWRKAPNLQQLGEDEAEARFSIALELAITWLNRILFLKLLEAQLKRWKPNDEFSTFLKADFIKDFDDLSQLFFEVLNRPLDQRRESIRQRYGNLPYLNSSLFEPTALEDAIFSVETLDDRAEMPLAANTMLKDGKGDRRSGKMITLHYLFGFLDAYDFSSDSKARIQADDRAVINAAVLGLIFEKINGYRDGSFFTPGFITMYMCRETLRRAVVQKFNARYGWSAEALDDLHNLLNYSKVAEYNELANSLRICDPAVGSGHFLVSALNELIALKSELGILCDRQGKRLHDVRAIVGNDELILTHTDTDQPIEYKPGVAASQRIQEALFQEKQTLIENCLFGVDINPKSVMICQLRLWIELLKHAYFVTVDDRRLTMDGAAPSTVNRAASAVLETLPNIDINIKTGNSLISRFALDEDLSEVFKKQKFSRQIYLDAVKAYKNSRDKAGKEELRQFIQRIKDEFRQTVFNRNPFAKRLSKLRGELVLLDNNLDLFGEAKRDAATVAKERPKLEADIADLERQLEDYKSGPLYRNSFEWRFEFPEVLDDAGNFVGFDVVVGNPPYKMIQPQNAGVGEIEFYKKTYPYTDFKIDLFHLFFQRGYDILKSNSLLSFIVPSSILNNVYLENLRTYFAGKSNIIQIGITEKQIFEEADVHTAVFIIEKPGINTVLAESFIHISTDLISVIEGRGGNRKFKQKNLLSLPGKVWNLLIDESNYPLIQKIFNRSRLSSISVINRGLISGDRDKYFSNEKINEKYVPILSGSDIGRYYHKLFSEYILFQRPKTSGGSWDTKVHFAKHKICIRQIGTSPTATIIEEPLAVTGNIFTVISSSLEIEKFILGVLNSTLIKYYWKIMYHDFKSTFPQVTIASLSDLPIEYEESIKSQTIISTVNQILAAKQADPKADTSALEAEIDQLVYGLYGLTEEEVRIVEGV